MLVPAVPRPARGAPLARVDPGPILSRWRAEDAHHAWRSGGYAEDKMGLGVEIGTAPSRTRWPGCSAKPPGANPRAVTTPRATRSAKVRRRGHGFEERVLKASNLYPESCRVAPG